MLPSWQANRLCCSCFTESGSKCQSPRTDMKRSLWVTATAEAYISLCLVLPTSHRETHRVLVDDCSPLAEPMFFIRDRKHASSLLHRETIPILQACFVANYLPALVQNRWPLAPSSENMQKCQSPMENCLSRQSEMRCQLSEPGMVTQIRGSQSNTGHILIPSCSHLRESTELLKAGRGTWFKSLKQSLPVPWCNWGQRPLCTRVSRMRYSTWVERVSP